jgi:hypothetical protein
MPRFLVATCTKCSAQIEIKEIHHSETLEVHPAMMYSAECPNCGEKLSGFVSDLKDWTTVRDPRRPNKPTSEN